MKLEKLAKFLEGIRFTVLFSGGKDSLATLLWILDNVRHSNWNILYVEVNGNTSSLCTQFVKYVTRKLDVYDRLIIKKRTDIEYYNMMLRLGVPLYFKKRWCLDKFKRYIFNRYASKIQVIGIRRLESRLRRSRQLIQRFNNNNIAIHPIVNWSKWDVIDYIHEHGLFLNPCYNIYGHGGNCMFCPLHNIEQIKRTVRDRYWRYKILDTLSKIQFGLSRDFYYKWLTYVREQNLDYKANI